MRRTGWLALGLWCLAGSAQAAGERHFVVGAGSEVSYHVTATILGFLQEAIDGVNPQVRGEVVVTGDRPAGWAEADVTGFTSGIKGRDRHVARILGFPRTPTVRFDLVRLLDFDASQPTGRKVAVGTLTANGASRSLQVPLQYRLEGGILRIQGEAPLRFADFGIAPPVLGLGLKRAPDDLVIRLDLVATERGPS